MPTTAGGTAASEWGVGDLLTRGKQTGTAIAPGGSNNTVVLCGGDSTLVVEVEMTGTAAADLVVRVHPYEADGVTPMPWLALPAVRTVGPSYDGSGKVFYYGEFDILSQDKVVIEIVNNNVGAQTINRASWRLS